ncbi:septum formation family protein [Dactylosporangium sp. NPDC005555]|uniref:septum formation family protein n=1 Tax=Dactylosporangium sp. NPDC005555 TaxID=3154889 RepID=UPI0033B1B1F5
MTTPVRTAMAAALAGLLLAVSGCALRPAGTDADLVDDWRPLAAPKVELPAAGACLTATPQGPFDPGYTVATPISCDRSHTLEVVLIGTVEGNAAQASQPPAPGSEAFQAAYTACGKAVTEYVGADWHTGMLTIDVRQPNVRAWQGGLRSYVCSVLSLSDAYGETQYTTGTLRGALAGAAPHAMRCFKLTGTAGADGWWDRLDALRPADCATPHEGEFAGTTRIDAGAGGKLPAVALLDKWAGDRCWTVVAKFVGLTEAALNRRDDIAMSWDIMDTFQWDAGDRHLRCFALVRPGKQVRASMRGLGAKGLPV